MWWWPPLFSNRTELELPWTPSLGWQTQPHQGEESGTDVPVLEVGTESPVGGSGPGTPQSTGRRLKTAPPRMFRETL